MTIVASPNLFESEFSFLDRFSFAEKMMINNPGVMGPQGPLPPSQGQPPLQASVVTAQMMPGGVINPQMSSQARQAQNDDILVRCLAHTQRLRESLEVLLNTTKQAALIDSEDPLSSSSSSVSSASAAANSAAAPNAASNPNAPMTPANSAMKNTIDRKLVDMSNSLDQLGQLLDQYDFKMFLNQQSGINHYNELSYEKQGTLMDEWSSNAKWMNKLSDILPIIYPTAQVYRRSNARFSSSTTRGRIDGPSSAVIDRVIAQVDQTPTLSLPGQQGIPTKDYSITSQRLSDHLTIVIFSLYRSGLDVYLYLRHCTVENVVVKPLNEKKQFGNHIQNRSISTYQALKVIAGHVRAAAVYFASSSSQSDQSLKKLLIYISKYNMLHSQKCTGCQKHLLNGLQPTWRDFQTYECYHEECLNWRSDEQLTLSPGRCASKSQMKSQEKLSIGLFSFDANFSSAPSSSLHYICLYTKARKTERELCVCVCATDRRRGSDLNSNENWFLFLLPIDRLELPWFYWQPLPLQWT